MSEWAKNPMKQPVEHQLVDLELNVDDPSWPGMPLFKFRQDPNTWEWNNYSGVRILRWKLSDEN